MSERTPTTEEIIGAYMYTELSRDVKRGTFRPGDEGIYRAEAERFLAAEKRKWQAEAWDEGVSAFEAALNDLMNRDLTVTPWQHIEGALIAYSESLQAIGATP